MTFPIDIHEVEVMHGSHVQMCAPAVYTIAILTFIVKQSASVCCTHRYAIDLRATVCVYVICLCTVHIGPHKLYACMYVSVYVRLHEREED